MRGAFFTAITIALTLASAPVWSQHDSIYYESYTSMITGRFYFSQKYTTLFLEDTENAIKSLEYHPNTTLNMGVGASYDWFTLNLAYGFDFLNPDQGKGETKYVDLQTHIYSQKINADLFGQFYSGFYLEPKGKGNTTEDFYTRPDIEVREFGANVQYNFNHKRFSYRASYLNNQWQKKSAGSFLLGAEFFGGRIQSDSSIYPTLVFTDTTGVELIKFFEFGPNAGYAYTLVLFKKMFITAALSLSLDYNVTTYESQIQPYTKTGISPNTFFRLFAGYNSERNAVSITFTNSNVALNSHENVSLDLNTGNLRINLVHRFHAGPKTRKVLQKATFN